MSGGGGVETGASLPGLGRPTSRAVTRRALSVGKDVVVRLPAMVVAVNLWVDVLSAVVDPRPRSA